MGCGRRPGAERPSEPRSARWRTTRSSAPSAKGAQSWAGLAAAADRSPLKTEVGPFVARGDPPHPRPGPRVLGLTAACVCTYRQDLWHRAQGAAEGDGRDRGHQEVQGTRVLLRLSTASRAIAASGRSARAAALPARDPALIAPIVHAQESDEDEQVRKTALREVRILKVRARAPCTHAAAAHTHKSPNAARVHAHSNSSTTTSSA